MTDFSMLDKDRPERSDPAEQQRGLTHIEVDPRKLVGPPSDDLTVRVAQANGVIAGELWFDPEVNEYKMLPEGEGFCPRCQLPLSQCCCKERGV